MIPIPVIAIAGGLFAAFLLTQRINENRRHRKQAESLNCQPAQKIIRHGFFGIPGLLHIIKALKEKRWMEFIASHHWEHGNTMQQDELFSNVTATIEPENIKAVLATQFNDFGLGKRHDMFHPMLGDGIFTLDGAGWSHARALLRPQFAREQVNDIAQLDHHISGLIDLIPKDGSSFNIQPLFFMLTIDSATHFLFGESIGSLESEITKANGVLEKSGVRSSHGFAEAFNTSLEVLAQRGIAMDLYWAINPRRFQEANRKIHSVVDYYVQLALNPSLRPEKSQSKDRYVFLDALAAETQNPKILRDNLLNILLAGRDTTAGLLSVLFWYLARHQNVWTRLRREVIQQFGDIQNPRDEITHARLKDIPYLRYVINEALRLLPSVPINFRIATRDTSLPVGGGPDGKSPIYIKKGHMVSYSVYAMHRRTDLWGKDAEQFRPERWEENAKHGWEYLPFNGGPRICLGQQYALTEASYTVVKLMQHFDVLENADPERTEPTLIANLTLSLDCGVPIRLYRSQSA